MPRLISKEVEPKVRAKRLNMPQPLMVRSRTIGAPMTYQLEVENISRSGILLQLGRSRKVPFRVNTLLELVVDTSHLIFEKPVSFLGKVVRVTDSEEPMYGVQIVQLEGNDLTAWEKGLSQLERAVGSLNESAFRLAAG